MKKHNQLLPLVTAISLASALALLFPRQAIAEDKSATTPKTTLTPAESASMGYDLFIADGKLQSAANGRGREATLDNVVDALRDSYTKANIVMTPGLAKLNISDLKLRAGRLTDELEAIRVASGLKFEWLGPGSPGPNLPADANGQPVDPATGQPVETASVGRDAGLFILREPAPTPEMARTVEAFNIGPYLTWLREKQDPKETQDRREQEVAKSLDELQQIIQVTIKSLKPGGAVEMPGFRFHSGANLLIVVGTIDAVEVARKVVNALPEQTGPSSAEAGAAGGLGLSGMNLELRKRYGLLPPTPAPSR